GTAAPEPPPSRAEPPAPTPARADRSRVLTTDSLQRERAERAHPTRDARRRHRSRRQLDDERRRPGEPMVLPVRRCAVRPRDAAIWEARERREPARRWDALPPGAHDPLRLVEPHGDLRPQ